MPFRKVLQTCVVALLELMSVKFLIFSGLVNRSIRELITGTILKRNIFEGGGETSQNFFDMNLDNKSNLLRYPSSFEISECITQTLSGCLTQRCCEECKRTEINV